MCGGQVGFDAAIADGSLVKKRNANNIMMCYFPTEEHGQTDGWENKEKAGKNKAGNEARFTAINDFMTKMEWNLIGDGRKQLAIEDKLTHIMRVITLPIILEWPDT